MVKEIQVRFMEGKDYCYFRKFDENGAPIWCLQVPRGTRVKSVYEGDELFWVIKNKDIESVLRCNDAQFGPFLDKQGKPKEDEKSNVHYLNEKAIRWLQYEDNYGRIHRCFNLNRGGKFFAGWMNYDCPVLELYETNQKNASCTIFGTCIPVFSETAIEVGMDNVYVSSSLSLDEVQKIANACYGSWTGEQLEAYVKNKRCSKEEVEAAKTRVEEAESEINRIIDENKDVIMQEVKDNEPDRFMLDCGWLNWSVYEPASLRDDLHLLKDTGIRCSSEPKIKIGIMGTQSTIAQSAGARKIVQILKNAGYQLSYRVHLD